MKLTLFSITSLLVPSIFLMTSCSGGDTSSSTNEDAPAEPVYEYIMEGQWEFSSDDSEVLWSRVLDQKATKKKVQIFGSMVDMELGPMVLNMEGNVNLKEGSMADEDGTPHKGDIVFDVSTFKLAKQKGNGLFDVKNHPYSTLEFVEFTGTEEENAYLSTLTLTIEGESKNIDDVPVSIVQKDSIMNLKGSFDFNTLDFPLRENVKKKDINKDVITVDMDINFRLMETVTKDSVVVN